MDQYCIMPRTSQELQHQAQAYGVVSSRRISLPDKCSSAQYRTESLQSVGEPLSNVSVFRTSAIATALASELESSHRDNKWASSLPCDTTAKYSSLTSRSRTEHRKKASDWTRGDKISHANRRKQQVRLPGFHLKVPFLTAIAIDFRAQWSNFMHILPCNRDTQMAQGSPWTQHTL
ncbi:hypothetical protein FGSG_13449 [Fusarium graminearum PH-1]|uniref:Chromosome 2, complete genome n=1 Tax=Gibberella zeae (strain ATCC MYA-4620 / CBS 123657 / FGSC 9075 / NRRL 31084 / PH-1) TaxID=229533 RepID=I1S9B9_GIBZE|nr:hypothetical protein FGSG_13449 [Fusarium graminearum PH-1]ESU15368.1 hypothetical protein FGSG_13449 [Fusarium graminearum PH-1]EYB25365.1 hypothetical protein FG05_13449 [Fusarium graminearum]CEF76283.1 unnamed protein product [Fusarium graminearum]|eukprot:XP_011320793.1 hypothetical protein FGSG_13449 [Fusarium graminearum PH-1]